TSHEGAPVWSRDGRRIALTNYESAYTVNPDGSGLLELKIDPILINGPVTLSSNRADRNADLGVESVPGTLGGGNWAKHNGNSAQCVPDYLCSTKGKPSK